MILRILNLEEQQNCMIGSHQFFKKIKNFKHRHVGCSSTGNRLEYCAAHSDFNLIAYLTLDPKNTLRNGAKFIGFYALKSFFLESHPK